MRRRDFFGVFRFAEERILIEQLRLLLGNVISSTWSVILLGLLMAVTLSNDANRQALALWLAVVIASKLASFVVAKTYLTTSIPMDHARPLAWAMIASYAVNGLAWGSLPWLTMDTATTAGRVVAISLMAGVIGSALAQTSSVLAVFFAFAVTTISLTAVKLLLLDDPAYTAFAAAAVLYLASLLFLARNNYEATLAAILLRFENTELMSQLRIETEIAEAARREAEHANSAKSHFLAAASHDLRQPVHAQGLFLNVLSRTPLTPTQRELVDNIRNTSVASGEMLSTLLDFSRIEAGAIRPVYQPFRVQSLLKKVEDELAPVANAKGLYFRSRETQLMAWSDPALLELMLRNFITNAIRYTERGGLLVSCRRRGDELALEVWDTGIGIAPDQQQEIFREFHQLGNPERDSRKGLGLGLAIAEGLAHTLGHRLSMESRQNRGSVFRVMLPVARDEVPDSAAVDHPASDVLNLRVLVIDDNEIIRASMVHLLASWGCECEAAENIDEALASVRARPPDIMISDHRLREQRTGTEAVAAVRALLGCELPALLITGDTAPERLEEAETSGIPLLHKPVAAEQLYHYLVKLTNDRGVAAYSGS